MERDDGIPPELAGYEPGDGGTLRGPRMRRIARIVVLLAVVSLVLPGVLIGVSTAARTAEVACDIVVAGAAPGATPEARWEWTGAEGPGWYCYASTFGGREVQLRFLGFIPEVRYRGDPPGVGV
ncbi:hypothetical protein H4J02_10625 [Protaetiibacter sp. SSC-01]|uniref:hypothetical protein n=1 Tax=Protaetiibacter sp. SSC-01 TaxID=2759943 RepID=UPI001656B87F|nr:hypothetical protein [Protaetiibacter sp. SSC-01]QNO36916.1 hypothetical protein H4J02_10625 [Protaetiibacter sp. SSC-01]